MYILWSHDSNSVPGWVGFDSQVFFPIVDRHVGLWFIIELNGELVSFVLQFVFSLLNYSLDALQLNNDSSNMSLRSLRYVFPAWSFNTILMRTIKV